MKHFKTNTRKSAWIRQLQSKHLEPQMKILEIVNTREAAIEQEKHWINHYIALGASLVNIDHTFQKKSPSGPNTTQRVVEKILPEQNTLQEAIQQNSDSPWVPMRQAAKLFGTSTNKISRLAEKQKIKTQSHPFDERARLVDLNELQALFADAPVSV